jgi:hypothetical protein
MRIQLLLTIFSIYYNLAAVDVNRNPDEVSAPKIALEGLAWKCLTFVFLWDNLSVIPGMNPGSVNKPKNERPSHEGSWRQQAPGFHGFFFWPILNGKENQSCTWPMP